MIFHFIPLLTEGQVRQVTERRLRQRFRRKTTTSYLPRSIRGRNSTGNGIESLSSVQGAKLTDRGSGERLTTTTIYRVKDNDRSADEEDRVGSVSRVGSRELEV